MITSIQGVSQGGGGATISPLHMWGSISQAGQAQVSALANQSSITVPGTSNTVAPLTYDAIDVVQTFTPVIPSSGLNAAQQQGLAAALGLTANATSADVLDAINALLIPADASQVFVNVLVGDANAATAEANKTNPFLYNDQGVIEGVPGGSVSQANDAALATLLDLGASGTTASTVAQASTGITENLPAAGIGAAANNAPTANLNLVLAGQIAIAENTAVMANPVDAAAVTASRAEAAPVAELAANTATIENATAVANPAIATAPVLNAETAAVTGEAAAPATTNTATAAAAPATAAVAEIVAPATTNVTTVAATATPATTVAEIVAPATIATNIATAAATPATIATNAITVAAIAATPVAEAVAAAPVAAALTTIAAATQTLQGLFATNVVQGNLSAAGVAAVPTAPATTGLGAAAEAAAPPVTTIPIIRFDNARSVLQILLSEAAAHAIMIQRNPASVTYSVGGAMFQMNTDADHLQQYTTKGNLPGIRDMTRPVSRSSGLRGSGEQKT